MQKKTSLAEVTPAPPKPLGDTEASRRELRTALGQFATGVTVIATRAPDGRLVGVTANSFGALSLEPPLVVWALRTNSSNLPAYVSAGRFVVSVLSEAQVDVSRTFASHADDKFASIPYALNRHDMPLLHGACAWFECKTVSHQTAGDHCLFIAEIENYSATEISPLVFHAGHYAALGSRL